MGRWSLQIRDLRLGYCIRSVTASTSRMGLPWKLLLQTANLTRASTNLHGSPAPATWSSRRAGVGAQRSGPLAEFGLRGCRKLNQQIGANQEVLKALATSCAKQSSQCLGFGAVREHHAAAAIYKSARWELAGLQGAQLLL